MTTRAEAASATAERILDAVTELFWERPTDQIVLRDVADRAGVTVQTVIRKYGGKEALLAAAADRAMSRTGAERAATPGDVDTAVEILLDHYEQTGAATCSACSPRSTARRRWPRYVERGPRPAPRLVPDRLRPDARRRSAGVARERRLAQLVAVCDVYTWKLLRLDSGLSRRQTQIALHELLGPLLTTHRTSTP